MIKNVLRKLDDNLLGSMVQKGRLRKRQCKDVEQLEDRCSEKFYVFYGKDKNNTLAKLCDKYGSDKGSVQSELHVYQWLPHSYADFYSRMFAHCRHGVKKVFECGLGTDSPNLVSSMGLNGRPGASLRMWMEYFPEAIIYGADIDRDILFEEGRIKTYFVDQLDPQAIAAFWRQVDDRDFDLMIDDGLHTFEAGSTLFHHSIERLADYGIYVIEDVLKDDLVRYKIFFDNTDYLVDFVTMFRPNVGLGDNSLIVIRKNL